MKLVDFSKFKEEGFNFPTIPLVYDKQTGEINEQNFYNKDDLSKKPVNIGGTPKRRTGINFGNVRVIDHNRYYLSIPAPILRSALEAGELQGELKEIASKITEDDNPVLMLVKFK
jgi:hypothetical protein